MKTLPVFLLLMAHLVASGNTFAVTRPHTQDPLPAKLEVPIDLMWSVLPPSLVKDNFGERTRNAFHVLEIIIGNNTSKTLLIKSAGVKLNVEGGNDLIVPFSSFQIVKLSVQEKSQMDRLCSYSFRENLIVDSNSQVRTLAFLPRSLLSTPDKKAVDKPDQVRKLVRDLVVIGNLFSGEPITLPSK